jgi:hypothetical protein
MPCRFASSKVASKMTSFKKSPSFGKFQGNEKWLEETVGNVGPVSVCIYASSNFDKYHSGNSSGNFFKNTRIWYTG